MDPINPEVTDPNTPPPEAQQAPADPTPTPASDPTDPFAAGVEEARAQEVGAAAPAQPQDPEQPPAGDPAPADPAKPQDPPPGEPAPQDPPPAEPPVEDPKPADQPKTVDEEIKELGITNERTQKRFRELSERAAEADSLRVLAARADEWQQTVSSTKATPEQFGNALGYLAAINSGDPAQMRAGYDAMQEELRWLGQKLGLEAPGFDPLSAHADLAEKVKAGELTREAAGELIQSRQRGALQAEHEQARRQEEAASQARDLGLSQVAAVGNQLRTSDPQFAQKLAYLQPTIEVIQASMPPEQWAQAVLNAYQKLPAVTAPAPAAPRPTAPNPIRPAAAPALAPKITQENAFEFGVNEARAAGR